MKNIAEVDMFTVYLYINVHVHNISDGARGKFMKYPLLLRAIHKYVNMIHTFGHLLPNYHSNLMCAKSPITLVLELSN